MKLGLWESTSKLFGQLTKELKFTISRNCDMRFPLDCKYRCTIMLDRLGQMIVRKNTVLKLTKAKIK